MRKAWFIAVVALLAVMLGASPVSARPSPSSPSGVAHTDTVVPDAGVAQVFWGEVCYKVRTATAWGDEKCSNGDDGPMAGCFNCELEFIQVTRSLFSDSGYRVLIQSGWGNWKVQPDKAGCSGCRIRAMELDVVGDVCCFVEYRVLTGGGWGEWRSFGLMAGCFDCTVRAIQMREKVVL